MIDIPWMTIKAQVDALLAQMTPAEKAGQLTQYFYFRLPEGAEQVLDFNADEQPKMVESKLQHGNAGSLLFLTDPAEIHRLQRPAVKGNRLGIPLLIGFDVSSNCSRPLSRRALRSSCW